MVLRDKLIDLCAGVCDLINACCEPDYDDPIAWICNRLSFCFILAKLFNFTVGPKGRVTDCIVYCGQVVLYCSK